MNDYIAQGGGEELMEMTPAELRVADRRLHGQRPGLPEVRRHEPLLRADVHRLFRRGAEGHRRRGAPAQQVRRNALDERRGPARVDRGRHRRHPAPGTPRRPRDARRSGRDDRAERDRLLDAREHDHGARVGAARQGQSGGARRRSRTPRKTRAAAHEKTTAERAQGGRRHGRGSRDAPHERAEADPCRRARDARHRQLLGRRAASSRARPNRRIRITAWARSSRSKASSSSA